MAPPEGNDPSGSAGPPDVQVLGQLLAAQSALGVLPTARHLAEFYARALASVPGVSASRVCLASASAVEGGGWGEPCTRCVELRSSGEAGLDPARAFTCGAEGQPEVVVFPLRTSGAHYGFFAVRRGSPEAFAAYRPFLANLGNFVALFLENRQQRAGLLERTAQLEAANRELEAFAYSVSHDLRAPLRHISGFVELLRRRSAAVLDEQGRNHLGAIADAARRLGQLVDDLLSFSRMGRAELTRSPVDLGVLVREVVGELEPETRGRTVSWLVGALPVISGDRAMLRTALVNLLSNALKFTRPRPRAEIAVCEEPGPPGEVVFFVRDNGVGFDMAHAAKLFGVFERLHRAAEFEGTGIGLANVRRVVERHGGRIWAQGAVGGGATFYVALPTSPSAPSPSRPGTSSGPTR